MRLFQRKGKLGKRRKKVKKEEEAPTADDAPKLGLAVADVKSNFAIQSISCFS